MSGQDGLGRAGWEHRAYQFTEDTDNNMVNVIFAITNRSPWPWGALGCRVWGLRGLRGLVLGLVWVALATPSV